MLAHENTTFHIRRKFGESGLKSKKYECNGGFLRHYSLQTIHDLNVPHWLIYDIYYIVYNSLYHLQLYISHVVFDSDIEAYESAQIYMNIHYIHIF
jgi:hypothetical protein